MGSWFAIWTFFKGAGYRLDVLSTTHPRPPPPRLQQTCICTSLAIEATVWNACLSQPVTSWNALMFHVELYWYVRLKRTLSSTYALKYVRSTLFHGMFHVNVTSAWFFSWHFLERVIILFLTKDLVHDASKQSKGNESLVWDISLIGWIGFQGIHSNSLSIPFQRIHSLHSFPSLPFLSYPFPFPCSFRLGFFQGTYHLIRPFALLSCWSSPENDVRSKVFSDCFPGMESRESLVVVGLASLARIKWEFIFTL